jgi:DNA-directed RNA polymerase specialized sigma24 family protein
VSYPARNADIALQLLAQFKGLIDGISYKMGVRYHLSAEDRADLVAAAHAKIATIRWRTVLRRRHGQCLNNYTISVIQNTMIKEVRRIKAFGLSGLTKGPAIAAFPMQHEYPQPEHGDSPFCRNPATDLADTARKILTPSEWAVMSLLHGFDGGDSRNAQQVARELDLSRSRVEVLIESSLQKMRRAVVS